MTLSSHIQKHPQLCLHPPPSHSQSPTGNHFISFLFAFLLFLQVNISKYEYFYFPYLFHKVIVDCILVLALKFPFYCIAHGTLLSDMWQPGREGSLGEKYIYSIEFTFEILYQILHVGYCIFQFKDSCFFFNGCYFLVFLILFMHCFPNFSCCLLQFTKLL